MDFLVPSSVEQKNDFINNQMVNQLTVNFDLNGLPQDVPQNIPFDGPVNSPLDAVQSDATGLITFNQDGIYFIEACAFVGRQPAVGTSMMVFDRYINESIASSPMPIFDYSDTSELISSFINNIPLKFMVGETLRFRVWTDSAAGNDNCGFFAKTITATASTAPSFMVTIAQLTKLL